MVNESPVVRYNDQCFGGARTKVEKVGLKSHGFEKIEEVGRFIQYHNISILEENIGEYAMHLPAFRKLLQRCLDSYFGEF